MITEDFPASIGRDLYFNVCDDPIRYAGLDLDFLWRSLWMYCDDSWNYNDNAD